MIATIAGNAEAGRLVAAALRRSVPANLVRETADFGEAGIAVLVAPDAEQAEKTGRWLQRGARKLVLFGAVPAALADILGIATDFSPPNPALGLAEPAPISGMGESPGVVRYGPRAWLLGGRHDWRRPLRRFDYADEWNNLGYGAIGAAGTIWDLGPVATVAGEDELAAIEGGGSYAALIDRDGSSALWFNRPVGPIDSFEWRLVENFLSAHRGGELGCVPVVSELVHGHDMVVTMRLDCDEDVESARPLAEAYRQRGVPLSLAIHTQQMEAGGGFPLLADVRAAGGAILSHSATHAPWWGGNAEGAAREVARSTELLEQATGIRPRHAVSPFHQTRDYAVAALAAAGYHGCIGGNIAADPAFNLARGGPVAGGAAQFVVSSQQCMLHGDCMLAGDDPMAVYRQAFELAHATRSLFAYLDHPFSARYQYGWVSETQRIAAHLALLDHIAAVTENPLYLNEDDALDFLRRRASVTAAAEGAGYRLAVPGDGLPLSVEYRGRLVTATDGLFVT